LGIQQRSLFLCRVQAVLKGLSHVPTMQEAANLLQGIWRTLCGKFYSKGASIRSDAKHAFWGIERRSRGITELMQNSHLLHARNQTKTTTRTITVPLLIPETNGQLHACSNTDGTG
jgi:hypothetical protein